MEGASTYAIVPLISGLCNVLIDRLLSENTRELLMGCDSTELELLSLRTSLTVVNDAEAKQLKSPDVRRWLNMVKHAVYDAEDLLDEIDTDTRQLKRAPSHSDTNPQSGTIGKITTALRSMAVRLNPFYEDVGSKIQKLNMQFKALEPKIKDLQLENFMGKRLPNSWQLSSEVVDESQIFDREKEKEEIVKVLEDLVKETYPPYRPPRPTKGKGFSSTYNRIPIVAIVGLAGIGKTTLAQLIFNDPRVLALFQFRSWACVPGEVFDVTTAIKDLLISSEEPYSLMSSKTYRENLGWLQKCLRHEVIGKKTLVVLDDVWDENLTADHFDELLIALNFAAQAAP